MSNDDFLAPDPDSQDPDCGNAGFPDLSGPDSPHFSVPPESVSSADGTHADGAEPPLAWQQVGEGRFMPMRVRGSCHGRALG